MSNIMDNSEIVAAPVVRHVVHDNGEHTLNSGIEINQNYARCVGEWLEHWAENTPNSVFLAQRDASDAWEELSYACVRNRVIRIATWLLSQNLSAERPVVILSDNGLEHALLMLASMHIGVPSCAISAGYSLISQDHAKLKKNIELLNPGVIYADSAEKFIPATTSIANLTTAVFVAGGNSDFLPDGFSAFSELEVAADEAAVMAAYSSVTPDTIAKFLFTSGSTGAPKAVINTQRMLCSSQMAKLQMWPFLAKEKPVLLEWLPWSHTFGTNHNFNLALCHGGRLYLDSGKPTPKLFEKTVQNMREISPNMYFSVPLAYDLLIPFLQDDTQLRETFFKNLRFIFYAGAALPQHTWESLRALAASVSGNNTMVVSSWGSTETSPLATDCHFQADKSGVIGVPIPGTTIKLVPNSSKLEVRIKGPNVFPGYWKNEPETCKAFDHDGFYKIGDAVKFVDPEMPEKGLLFDGRVSEDFKLLSGTWVHVGAIRLAGIAALKPFAQDIVVTGHDRNRLGFLIFPNITACRTLCPELSDDATPADIIANPAVIKHLKEKLLAMHQSGGGSSTYPKMVALMDVPPSSDAGEITDKGYINQRMVLIQRKQWVERLYADGVDDGVIKL